ncbi:MAG TPA: calcium-binding protein [Acidobacteriaceae bacterium]
MPHIRAADSILDSLIDEITVDCHDQDEQLMGFANAFDEVSFPYPGTIIGEEVQVLSISAADDRPDLLATCKHGDRTHDIALLDVVINADADTSRLIAAYRRWTALCR